MQIHAKSVLNNSTFGSSYWNRNGTFDSYMSVLVLFIVYVGCRRDVLDHTSCGFVMYIVLYSGVVVNC